MNLRGTQGALVNDAWVEFWAKHPEFCGDAAV